MKQLSLIIIILTFSIVSLQGKDDKRIFMRVNGSEVTVSEFTRLYERNIIEGQRQSFEEYIRHFKLYRLKVAHAMEEGLNRDEKFINELKGYRQQVAAKYLTDSDLIEEMLQRQYERMNYEINASHILVAIPPSPTSSDTLYAWKKAMDILDRLSRGEPFSEVAVNTSDDTSAPYNGGNLGYFSSLQMLMPFEDAAYNLKPGEISEPVRTTFGYHIIKVHDIRASRGNIKVAHIMKAVPQAADPEQISIAASEIRTIYNRVLSGESFSEIAKQESDHRESAAQGGELSWFRIGEIVNEFAEAAFSLTSNGEISEPVRTAYGWHIIRRVDWRDHGSYEENRPLLEYQLLNSELNSVARKSFIEKLKREYHYQIDTTTLRWFIKKLSKISEKGEKNLERSAVPNGNIFQFNGGELTATEFTGILESLIGTAPVSNPNETLFQIIDNKAAQQLLAYEDSRLDEKYPEFRYLMKEYHDGILLFEITTREIWNRAYSDTADLLEFYYENIALFTGKSSITGNIYSTDNRRNLRVLRRLINRYAEKTNGDEKIRSEMTRRKKSPLIIENVHLFAGDNDIADQYLEGALKLYIPNRYNDTSLIYITELIPGKPSDMEAISGDLVVHYQEQLEALWNRQLKERYSVWVDEDILRELTLRYNEK